jgi:adenosylcobinamide-phosphate synthase
MEWLILLAFALDLLLGDPRRFPHPVVYIGMLVNHLEIYLSALLRNRYQAGVLLTATTLLAAALIAWGLLALAHAFHPLLGVAVWIWLAFTTLALRSLHVESREVVNFLEAGKIEEARRALALIVGRDTASLDQEGILKACIETVSENTSDAVVAPLFYLFLGGPILAVVFKAASTLDSMVGYRTDRYREIGWAAARLDDLLNLIPARLTAILMIIAAPPLGLNAWGALQMVMRDSRKPSSPNAGFPEAAAAGALGVQLGGAAYYFGEKIHKPTLGDPDRPVTIQSYYLMVRLMYLCSFLALGMGILLSWLIR